MRSRSLLFALLLTQAAWAQSATAPAAPCPLEVPSVLTRTSETAPQVKCACRITSFQGKVYSRMGQEVFATTEVAQFPSGLLLLEQVASGTYLWVVEYTAIVGADPVPLKVTGYLNVL